MSAAEDDPEILRDQLASFRPMLALSMMMTNSRDENEILRIAVTAVPSLGGCRVETVRIDDAWRLVQPAGGPEDAEELADALAALGPASGRVEIRGAGWAWAYALGNQRESFGHLVVSRDSDPDQHHRFLLNVLVQQVGVALSSARLHARQQLAVERERAAAQEARAANIALERAMVELRRSATAVKRSLDIHDRLTAVSSAGAGQEGIARAVFELTGLAVAIEDRHGNLAAWAGPGRPDPYPKPSPARREQAVRRAARAPGPVRLHDRLFTVARRDSEVLGVIALIDPEHKAGDSERVALEHANTVLTSQLMHLRALGEVELRLRRDLTEELLAGVDPASARERALALGYDLGRPHRVVVITDGGDRQLDHDAFFGAVLRAVRGTGIGSLIASRSGGVAVLCHTDCDWEKLRAAMDTELRSAGRCRVGVGMRCVQPPEQLPRSYEQALLALKMQRATRGPAQVTVFDDLGVYRLLSRVDDVDSVESFIHEWLGALLDYDAAKHARLVETLSVYLEHGGNYDETAKVLCMHRSTLRYRLKRIREISGYEIGDPDLRFNLQLATRAWTTVHAMRGHGG